MAPIVPATEAIPGSPLLFLILNILTFFFHILAMNLLLGGFLILLFDRQARNQMIFLGIPRYLTITFAFTINLGVAPLLFMQVLYGHLFYTSSILMAWFWITLIPLLITAYYGAYISYKKSDNTSLFKITVMWISLSLLWVAFIFSNNMTMMISPERFVNYFDNRSGTILNLKDPMLLPRYLHHVVASVAVGYLALGVLMYIKTKDRIKAGYGLRRFGVFTLIQVGVGIWLFLSLRGDVINGIFKDTYVTTFLGGGILFGILAIIFAFRNRLIQTTILACASIFFMILNRHNIRSIYLDQYFSIHNLEVSFQTFNLILFISVLLIGILLVWYLIRIGIRVKEG